MINAPTMWGDYPRLPGLTTTTGGAGSHIWELYYLGERLYPLPPPPSLKDDHTILNIAYAVKEPLLPIPRNRAELRAAKSRQRRKKKR